MSTVLTIATRELRERARLFIVAAALAILPFAIALAPGAESNRARTIMLVGVAAASAYACAVALAMGISTIGRDLTEKRLSFYFSKPISPRALWIGKAGASLLVALASFVIIAVPSFLAARGPWRSAWIAGFDRFALGLPFLVGMLFFGTHAIGTMTRSRSALVALDFLLAVVAGGVVTAIARPIILAGGIEVSVSLRRGLGAGLLAILAVTPFWQLTYGRTDARRSHAAFSKFFWSALAVLLLLAAGFLVWLRSAKPADLVEVANIDQSPASGWAFVTGLGAHRGDFHSTFLMNAATGEYFRMTMPWSGVAWSRDGRVAAWIEPVEVRRPDLTELYVRSMDSEKNQATGIRARIWCQFTLSDDGTRMAIADDGLIAVHDLRSHRLLASARGMESDRSRFFFVSNDVLRIIDFRNITRVDSGEMRVSDLDVRTRKLTTYGQRKVPHQGASFSVSEDGSRMLIHPAGEIVDGRTLVTLAKTPPAGAGSTMLSDGSVAIIGKEKGVRLRLFDRDGQPRGELALPNCRSARVSSETTDGKLLVVTSQLAQPARQGHAVVVVDRAKLAIDRVVPDVNEPMPEGLRMVRYAAGTAFLGEDGKGKLKVWR
jgi:hypothetical protein